MRYLKSRRFGTALWSVIYRINLHPVNKNVVARYRAVLARARTVISGRDVGEA